MMDNSSKWAKNWGIKFNNKQSNVIHFRKKSKPVTHIEFYPSGQKINIAEQYKYLGVMLSELVDFNIAVKQLSDAGRRALDSF